jgi:hypothetical protein
VSVRLAAAGCLRHLCAAVPAVLTPLIDKSVEALETYKSAQEAVSGYSGGLAALLGAVRSVREVNFLTLLTAEYRYFTNPDPYHFGYQRRRP